MIWKIYIFDISVWSVLLSSIYWLSKHLRKKGRKICFCSFRGLVSKKPYGKYGSSAVWAVWDRSRIERKFPVSAPTVLMGVRRKLRGRGKNILKGSLGPSPVVKCLLCFRKHQMKGERRRANFFPSFSHAGKMLKAKRKKQTFCAGRTYVFVFAKKSGSFY